MVREKKNHGSRFGSNKGSRREQLLFARETKEREAALESLAVAPMNAQVVADDDVDEVLLVSIHVHASIVIVWW